jgi:hypothetical protein
MGNHIKTILSRGEDFFKFHPPFFLFSAWWQSWLEVGITGHNFKGEGTQGPFHQSLVAIGPMVSEEKIKM